MILPYTTAEAESAHDQWNAMCGHFSIAAATGRPLEDIRTAGVPLKGWMNPTMIRETLESLHVPFDRWQFMGTSHKNPEAILETDNLKGGAILRIQWEGSWMNPGVPKGAQYQRTHYIACKAGRIMDPAMGPNIHMPVGLWLQEVPKVVSQIKGATSYHFTHAWTINS